MSSDRRTQLDNSLYPEELAHISKILKALNDTDVLMYLDGELNYYNDNADRIAIFWFDSEVEQWRVQIGLFNEQA